MSGLTKKSAMLLLAAAMAASSFSALAAGDVKVAVASTFTTMDPWDANDTLSQNAVRSFYEGLFRLDKDMKLKNVLALSYEPSADGLSYIVKLRQGVKFHDGEPFNAAAVKANFDRITNPNNHLKRYSLYKNIARTDVIDEYTVKFTLHEPFSAFINQLGHPSAAMISPKTLAKGKQEAAFHPVGTGPFVFQEWKQTDYMKVTKNPNYWRKGYPKVDSITWIPVVENATRAAMIQTGEAHFAYPMPFEQVKALEGKPGVKITKSPSIIHRYISMNMNFKPFDNPKVRQAINYAINKEALCKVAFNGYAVPAAGPLPEGVSYAVKLGPWPYNPAKARALLKEAGYPSGFRTTLWSAYNHTTAQKVIQFVQQQLAQVGIKATVQALEAGQRVSQVESVADPKKAGVRMYYIGWSTSTGEADWALRPLLAGESHPPRMTNTAYYTNAVVDNALKAALNTTDEAKKAAYYKEAQEQIWKDAPWAFLVTEVNVAAGRDNLSGFHIMPDGGYDYDEITLK
ncbi:MAG: glutathione ABC transporter substrate-binding protein GsiB [Duodenibacillus sp.]